MHKLSFRSTVESLSRNEVGRNLIYTANHVTKRPYCSRGARNQRLSSLLEPNKTF